jgi:hypothetical protein
MLAPKAPVGRHSPVVAEQEDPALTRTARRAAAHPQAEDQAEAAVAHPQAQHLTQVPPHPQAEDQAEAAEAHPQAQHLTQAADQAAVVAPALHPHRPPRAAAGAVAPVPHLDQHRLRVARGQPRPDSVFDSIAVRVAKGACGR